MNARGVLELQEVQDMEKRNMGSDQYLTGSMDKSTIIELLRKEGFRVTRQRAILIDIILAEECTCCKEIYYIASKQIHGIGVATIYRTISALEKIGALKRKGAYQLCCRNKEVCERFLIELEDASVVVLDPVSLQEVIEKGLKQCGYSTGRHVKAIRHVSETE